MIIWNQLQCSGTGRVTRRWTLSHLSPKGEACGPRTRRRVTVGWMSRSLAWLSVVLAAAMIWPQPATCAEPQKSSWEDFWKTENRLRSHGKIPMESVDIGSHRQLFVDNYVLEFTENLKRTLHQPIKHPENPVIRPTKPWEAKGLHWASIIYDAEEDVYKAWYLAIHGLCYATSEDGIHWKKPELGIREWRGATENNLIRPYVTSPTIIKDPFASDPSRRYKCFALERDPMYAMYVSFSPDGIHWTRKPEPVLSYQDDPGMNDRPNMMQDLARRRFLAFTKREMINPFGRGDWGFIHRCRAVSISEDFKGWSTPVIALHPDDQDPPTLQIYGLSAFNYEGQYLGLMGAYHSGQTGREERTTDVQLVTSRDGEVWWRAGHRQTFIPVGPDNAWDRFNVHPNNCAPIVHEDALWIIYSGSGDQRHRRGPTPENRRKPPWNAPGHPPDKPLPAGTPHSGVGIASLRLDGFVSLDAGSQPGCLFTRPLIFDGDHLRINADAADGCIRAELFEATRHQSPSVSNSPAWNWQIGDPIPGYTLQECIPFKTDSTNGVIRWENNETLESLAGKKLVIRFQLRNASMYSFWIR